MMKGSPTAASVPSAHAASLSSERDMAPIVDRAAAGPAAGAAGAGHAQHHHVHHEEAQMREDDDTILEVGIGHPGTPVFKPIAAPSAVPSLSGISEEGVANVGALSYLPPQPSSTSRMVQQSVCRGSLVLRDCRTNSGGCQPVLIEAGSAGKQPQHPMMYRRCLSGDDSAVASFGGDRLGGGRGTLLGERGGGKSSAGSGSNHGVPPQRRLDDPSAAVSSASPVSVAEDGPAAVLANLARVADGGSDDEKENERGCAAAAAICHEKVPVVAAAAAVASAEDRATKALVRGRRSKSIDRLLNEAAQFAEAVGEVPPRTEAEVLGVVIQEDSSSDDDDDDDEGTVVDAAEAAEALPSAKSSLAPFREERGSLSLREESTLVGAESRDDADREEDAKQRLDRGVSSAPAMLSVPATPKDDLTPQDREPMSGAGERSEAKRPWVCSRKQFGLPPRQHSTVKHHMTLLRFEPDGDSSANTPFSSSSSGLPQRGQSFAYRGIHSKHLEITKRGISRGNYAQLHRKAWLEVSDKYHRYGKNLRAYYKHWESLGHPTNMFFDWLDSKGEAAGEPLPNLPECPRSDLDSDTVLYITNPEITERYAIDIIPGRDGNGSGGGSILVDSDGEPVRTGPEGWIFVLRDHVLYGTQKVTSVAGKSKQRFHHSSFFGGKAVAAAGILITDDAGRLKRLYPHSGHYRPGEAHMQRMLFFLQQRGMDLNTFDVDLQQILHVSRTVRDANTPKGGNNLKGGTPKGGSTDDADKGAGEAMKKAKKVDSLHLMPALHVACFLAHKARMIGEGTFCQVHKIRVIGAVSVTGALVGIDEGGYWKNLKGAMHSQMK